MTYFYFCNLISVSDPYRTSKYTSTFFDGLCMNLVKDSIDCRDNGFERWFNNFENWLGTNRILRRTNANAKTNKY